MSDPVISATPAAAASTTATAKTVEATAPIRWSFVLAWTVAAFATLLALFAWLPWIYPRAALMTPYGALQAQMPVTADDSRFAALESRIAALSQQTPMETAAATPTAGEQAAFRDEAVAAATKAAAETANRIALQTATQVAGEAATTAAHSTALKTVAPLLAAARLEDRLARGAAYRSELETLSPSLTEPEKADLAPLAGGGPDVPALAARLEAQRRTLLADYREHMAGSWWEKTRARLSAIISISAPGDMPDAATAAIAKLQAQIAQNDTAGALATLHMLPQAMQTALQPLEADLSARLRAEAAIDSALARLTAAIPAGEETAR